MVWFIDRQNPIFKFFFANQLPDFSLKLFLKICKSDKSIHGIKLDTLHCKNCSKKYKGKKLVNILIILSLGSRGQISNSGYQLIQYNSNNVDLK